MIDFPSSASLLKALGEPLRPLPGAIGSTIPILPSVIIRVAPKEPFFCAIRTEATPSKVGNPPRQRRAEVPSLALCKGRPVSSLAESNTGRFATTQQQDQEEQQQDEQQQEHHQNQLQPSEHDNDDDHDDNGDGATSYATDLSRNKANLQSSTDGPTMCKKVDSSDRKREPPEVSEKSWGRDVPVDVARNSKRSFKPTSTVKKTVTFPDDSDVALFEGIDQFAVGDDQGVSQTASQATDDPDAMRKPPCRFDQRCRRPTPRRPGKLFEATGASLAERFVVAA